MNAIIQPKGPREHMGWVELEGGENFGYPFRRFVHLAHGLSVMSAVEVANEPGELGLGPEYHLSVCRFRNVTNPLGGRRIFRCDEQDARTVLRQFGLEDAREDNHVPSGFMRNFWRPVADRLSGYECPCVDAEPAMREDKGDFVWRGTSR